MHLWVGMSELFLSFKMSMFYFFAEKVDYLIYSHVFLRRYLEMISQRITINFFFFCNHNKVKTWMRKTALLCQTSSSLDSQMPLSSESSSSCCFFPPMELQFGETWAWLLSFRSALDSTLPCTFSSATCPLWISVTLLPSRRRC